MSSLLLVFYHFFSSAGGRASTGPRASFPLGGRASTGRRDSFRRGPFATQSPAHSCVPSTVPNGLQPTGPFSLTCTGGLLPTSGASCANAPAENSNTAIIKIDFISVPYVPYVPYVLNAASSLK